MQTYWFSAWLAKYRVTNKRTLEKALTRGAALDSLLSAAPRPTFSVRSEPSELIELTGGKGIDLTGELGCRHIDCLRKEVEGLFRHTWHYFDRIVLPDQAVFCVVDFKRHKDASCLLERLLPFVSVLKLLDRVGAERLVRFESRLPSCLEHAEEHAREANIEQAFTNTRSLTKEIVNDATISWDHVERESHIHLDFRLDHPEFEHPEWGSLCSRSTPIPKRNAMIRQSIAVAVVARYLAALSADALAARRTHTVLGSTVPFYKRLLATHPSAEVDEVAFNLNLPISADISIEKLIKLREAEKPSFERFQAALRRAIGEHIKTVRSSSAAVLAREIQRDIIGPELRRIRDLLAASRSQTTKSAATGLGLGMAAATVGLLTPLSANSIGTGLVVGGAITMGLSSIKKAVDDDFVVRRDVSLSDMYFLWQAHRH